MGHATGSRRVGKKFSDRYAQNMARPTMRPSDALSKSLCAIDYLEVRVVEHRSMT